MSTVAEFEIGVSAPDARCRRSSFPSAGNWSPEALAVIAEYTPRKEWAPGRYVFAYPHEEVLLRQVLAALRRSGVEPVIDYHLRSNPSPKNVHAVPWYLAGVHLQSDGFSAREAFEHQRECGLPKPEPVIGHDAGCGLRKAQRRKLQLVDARRVRVGDVIEPLVEPLVLSWQLLVVSRRFRDAMMRSGLTGFAFLPIAGPDAAPAELSLDSGNCASDTPDYFQWVIFGRTRPVGVQDFVASHRECRRCGRVDGDSQPYYVSQPMKPAWFEPAKDVQACTELEVRDGRRFMCLSGNFFVSSRLVELCLREKFRGLTGLTGRAPSFTALYFGEAL